jgi:aminobenzoyl-glutamate utilization protein A
MDAAHGITDEEREELGSLVKIRRSLHQWPELGFREFVTTAVICGELGRLGFQLICGADLYDSESRETIRSRVGMGALDEAWKEARERLPEDPWLPGMAGGLTGVIGHLRGALPGPRVGLRFDLDALPVTESKEADHLPAAEGFASVRRGCMHACGHDGHTTIGLGLARRLQRMQSELKGEVFLIFQPAEEIGAGARLLSRHKAIAELDYLVAVHLGILERRAVVCGVSFMALRELEVTFVGRNAHAGHNPQDGRNALQAACGAVQNLYGIARHSGGASRIGIGNFKCSNSPNVIPDSAGFTVQVRGRSNAVLDYLTEQAKAVVTGAGMMWGVQTEIKPGEECPTHPNSPHTCGLIRQACLAAGIPAGEILDEFNASGSEDAPYLMRSVAENGGQSAYMVFGSNVRGGHHNPKWDFDEDLMLQAVSVLWEFCRLAAP